MGVANVSGWERTRICVVKVPECVSQYIRTNTIKKAYVMSNVHCCQIGVDSQLSEVNVDTCLPVSTTGDLV